MSALKLKDTRGTIKVTASLHNGDVWGQNEGAGLFGNEITRLLCNGVHDEVIDVRITLTTLTGLTVELAIPNLEHGRASFKVLHIDQPTPQWPAMTCEPAMPPRQLTVRSNPAVHATVCCDPLSLASPTCGRTLHKGWRILAKVLTH